MMRKRCKSVGFPRRRNCRSGFLNHSQMRMYVVTADARLSCKLKSVTADATLACSESPAVIASPVIITVA